MANVRSEFPVQDNYPSRTVSFRCPDSALGARKRDVNSLIFAKYESPIELAGKNTSAWISHVSMSPTSNLSAKYAAEHFVYTVSIDCGSAVGIANATCAIDSSTGVPLDVTFSCPALTWSPSCG